MSLPQADGSGPPTLKPRPRLFAVLCALFAVWLAALAVLYGVTVYPQRHPPAPGPQAHPAQWK